MAERIKVLFVDDEACVLRSISRLFFDGEYEVVTASSAQEGLAVMAGPEPPCVVASDYGMPGMNGVAFLRRVCQDWPETITMILSGYADMPAISAAINDGQICKFIPKPWNDQELKAAVAGAAARFRLQKDNALLKAVFASLPVGVVAVDSSGMVVEANPAWQAIAGQTAPVGLPAADVLPLPLGVMLEDVVQGSVVRRALGINGRMYNVIAGPMAGCAGTVLVIDGE